MLSMRVFLISKSKPGFGTGVENTLGIPSHVEFSAAGQNKNTLLVLCLWYFNKEAFMFKTRYIDSYNALCTVHKVGYRPEPELIYRGFPAGELHCKL